jgi:hypothetical protein
MTRSNPLASTESAPNESPSAGTQLRIAARGKADPHDVSPTVIVAEVGRLVQALSDRNDSLVEQVRADAARELGELQAVVERHEADLRLARASLASATEQAATERSSRRRAEQERDAARAELADLTRELESVRADRGRLADALATIRQAVLHASPEDDRNHSGVAAPEVAVFEPLAVQDAIPVSSVDPELADHVKRLLEQAKEMYLADMKSGTTPADVVDRLTSILRYSRDLVLHRTGGNATSAAEAFNEEVNRLLDAEGASSFGRHLSIAAFAARNEQSA